MAGLLAVATSLPAAGSVVIGVVGDFGGASQGPTFAANELAVANLLKGWSPDFIITTGDNNYREGTAATIDVNIGQFYHEYIYPYLGVHGNGATSNRFFPCLGNHDWATSNGKPFLDYFALPGNERYFAYRHGPVEVFAINSNADADGTTSSSVQARWLQTQLAASTARWRLVYFHHPPYSASAGGAVAANLRWPFAAWGASAVLTGHDHIYARIHTNGIAYFINGLGGESIGSLGTGANVSAVRYNGDYGAMRIEGTETNLVFHFVTRNNVIVDTYVLGDRVWSPFILSPPLSQTVPAGRTVNFNVLAAGPAGLRYQWQFNSADIPGATNSVLVRTNVQTTHEGEYEVVVSHGTASIRTGAATLALLRHPLITQHPRSQTAPGGATVTFHVTADGAGSLRHQWFFNGAGIAGANVTNLSLTNVNLASIGDYAVRVTDDVGSLFSEPARLNVLVRPVITQQALSQSAAAGGTVVFSISASGTLPMNYSWRRNGLVLTNIMLNDTTCFWTIANVQPANAGNYQVGITNLAGPPFGGLSSAAVLTVLEDLDGDGLPDAWEAASGFKPDDASDATLDADGDGLSNLHEYIAETDPNSAASCLRIERISVLPSGESAIAFAASSNKTYMVEYRDEEPDGSWKLLAPIAAVETNRLVEIKDAAQPGRRRFYRLVTPRMP